MYRAKYRENRKKNPFKRMTALLLAIVLLSSAILFDHFAFFAPVSVMAAGNDDGLEEHIIDTISPSHVKFNLFDYWLIDRETTSSGEANRPVQGGINEGHPFIFGGLSNRGRWNVWTGNSNHYNAQPENPGIRYGEYKGIVKDTLTDGYPTLDLIDDTTPDYNIPGFMQGSEDLLSKREESLAYLFDPDIENEYKEAYENVQGLVKYDGNGGYVYNSHENYAAFQKSADGTLGTNGESSDGYFDVYDSWALMGSTSPNGQFFPFDGAEEVFQNTNGVFEEDKNGHLISQERRPTAASEAENLNHFMGMTMETVFLQPESGRIDQDTPMSFTFSGDDDVWIFIDNVLVSDLGGIHDECFTIIDFETGNVYTGLTPIVQNDDGSFSENIPTLDELQNQIPESCGNWSWYDRTPINEDTTNRVGTVSGDYDAFAKAHNIQTKTLKEIFESAGEAEHQTWGNAESGMSANTFDQNTQHELKMFYLERGAGASNLVLEFNMLAVPASGVTKTDQDGRPVSGAEFALWPAKVSDTALDEYGNQAPLIDEETGLYIADKEKYNNVPICTATTDENGHLSFITDTRKIISFQERAQSSEEYYYVLEEITRPTGYRSKGDISLYYSIYNTATDEGVLLSYNYWQTGAYTQAKLDVTMTEDLYRYELGENGQPDAKTPLVPEEITDKQAYLDEGIIFAVPIKRMDMNKSLYDEENFHAIYGTTNTGWTLMTEPISNQESVLEAAKQMMAAMQQTRQTGTIIAERNARQLFHVEITNIPGDVKLTYPYLMESGQEERSEYNIAFYFAPNAETLDEVNASEIIRIGASTPDGTMFERQYASQFYVSNTFNRVRVQKLDYHGNRLSGATFNMYQTYSTWDRGEDYALVNEALDPKHQGMYRNTAVVNEDGTLKDREVILQTTVWDKGSTKSGGSAGPGSLDLDGAFIFPTAFDTYIFTEELQSKPYQVDPSDTSTYIEEGEYVIFETDVPSEGYLINEQPISVTVNDDGVFADAGQVNDGIRVGQYAGWILNSMSQFAAESAVDETLTFINSTLQVFDENGQLQSPVEGDITWMNKYSNENHRYIFFAEDVGRYVTSGRNLYQFTDQGTPKLQIQQNNDVAAQVIILAGEHGDYSGPVTVNKINADGSTYTLQGVATKGTLAFWLRKSTAESGGQTLGSVQIENKTLAEGTDYYVYDPHVTDLSTYEDLSGLFSIETLVQVYDQNMGDLEVSKEIANVAEGSSMEDQIFYYRVYGVYEQATKIVLAQADENGETLLGPDGKPVLNTNFNGTLNVRLRENIPGASTQMTATNIAVDFEDGEALIYLEPDYEVEYVYIPGNADHGACGLVGLVETQITLDEDSVNGTGQVTTRHIAFQTETHTHQIEFENGVGKFYRNPDYAVEKVVIGNATYEANSQEDGKGLESTSRFNYATIHQVQNLEVNDSVAVAFTEEDGAPSAKNRVITQTKDSGPGKNVTVYWDDSNGEYQMEYNLMSDTHEQAVVAQFALYGGQTIHIQGLAGGTTYYVYEYGADREGVADSTTLAEDWTTKIEITPQGAQNGTLPITDPHETVIQDEHPEFRAAMGIIRTNATQKVDFKNTAKVGSLTLSKEVLGQGAPAGDVFQFEITLTDEEGTALAGSYSYTGGTLSGSSATAPPNGTLTLNAAGKGSISLSQGQSITVDNLPLGTQWTVQEQEKTNYLASATATDGNTNSATVTGASAQGDIQKDGEKDTAAFQNTYTAPIPAVGSLTISKEVSGESADEEKKFQFEITLTDGEGDALTGSYSYTGGILQGSGATAPQDGTLTLDGNGVGIITLSDGQTIAIEDLPVGAKYKVVEGDYKADGYTASIGEIAGTIFSEETISFENVYAPVNPAPQTGNLTISKTVTGDGAPAGDTFQFNIVLTDGEGNALTGSYSYTGGTLSGSSATAPPNGTLTLDGSGSGTIALSAGQTITIEDLPVGTKYTVAEEDPSDEGYTANIQSITGEITSEEGEILSFENAYAPVNPGPQTGSLQVSKKVEGENPDANKEFRFEVTFTGQGAPASQQFTLKAGESWSLSDIPAGVHYTVRETDAGGYLPDVESVSGTVVAGTTEQTFTNRVPTQTQDPAKLIISKQLAGNYPTEDLERAFRFTLKINGTESTFTLKAGEEIELELAPGTSYELIEEDYSKEGYRVSIVNGSGTAQSGQSIQVVATNTFSGSGIERVISGEKTWDLRGEGQTALPDSITVYLTADGQVVERQEVFPDNQGEWKYTFTVPKYDAEGNEIVYGIGEEPIGGFQPSYNGYNIHNTRIVPVKVSLPNVHKEVIGTPLVAETFRFLLEGQNGAPMPEGAMNGRLSLEMNGSGETSLGSITFTQEGDYRYTITEIAGGKTGWTYDNSTYTLTVTISEQGGNLVAQTVLKNQRGAQVKEALFINQWENPISDQPNTPGDPGDVDKPDTPNAGTEQGNSQMAQTGDNRNITPWVALAILSGGSFAAILIYKRKTAK